MGYIGHTLNSATTWYRGNRLSPCEHGFRYRRGYVPHAYAEGPTPTRTSPTRTRLRALPGEATPRKGSHRLNRWSPPKAHQYLGYSLFIQQRLYR